MKIIIIIILLFLCIGYYVGWDYGVDISKYKNMLNQFKIESFENLGNIYFTSDECVYHTKTVIDENSYISQCSKGLFKCWFNGKTSILISTIEDDDVILLIIAHELGHLQQFNQQEYDFSQDGADEYAMLFFK